MIPDADFRHWARRIISLRKSLSETITFSFQTYLNIGIYLSFLRHDIAEILLKLALNTNQSINQSIIFLPYPISIIPLSFIFSHSDKSEGW
jgi:hypothetical protein